MFDIMGDIKLTVDLVVTAGRGTHIVLITRRHEPFLDKLTLPGGYFHNSDISIKAACARQGERVGLDIRPSSLQFLTELDCVTRDPRPGDRRISFAYTFDYPDKETLCDNIRLLNNMELVHVAEVSSLREEDFGFDHWRAILALKAKYR